MALSRGAQIRELEAKWRGALCPYCGSPEKLTIPDDGCCDLTRVSEVEIVQMHCAKCRCLYTVRAASGECRLATGGVYYASVPGFIKIGQCSDLAARLCMLVSGNPHPVSILRFFPDQPGSFRGEDEQRHFDRWRSFHHRGEWFIEDVAITDWLKLHGRKPWRFLRDSCLYTKYRHLTGPIGPQ